MFPLVCFSVIRKGSFVRVFADSPFQSVKILSSYFFLHWHFFWLSLPSPAVGMNVLSCKLAFDSAMVFFGTFYRWWLASLSSSQNSSSSLSSWGTTSFLIPLSLSPSYLEGAPVFHLLIWWGSGDRMSCQGHSGSRSIFNLLIFFFFFPMSQSVGSPSKHIFHFSIRSLSAGLERDRVGRRTFVMHAADPCLILKTAWISQHCRGHTSEHWIRNSPLSTEH